MTYPQERKTSATPASCGKNAHGFTNVNKHKGEKTMVGKKRLLLAAGALASVGAVVALATGVTFGFFSASTTSSDNTFTAGTVTLTKVDTQTCTVGPMAPGDSSPGWHATEGNLGVDPNGATGNVGDASTLVTCDLHYDYSGTNSAYLALDVKVAGDVTGEPAAQTPYGGTLSTPTTVGLFDGTSTGLRLLVKDTTGSTTFVDGENYNPQTALATALDPNGSTDDLLINSVPTLSRSGDITVDYYLADDPSTNDNYQGAKSTITLTVHAVQTANNPLPATCAVGDQCDTGISWS